MNLVTTMLLNILNNPQSSTVDCDIAKYIIENHETINNLSISELSDKINVSISQVSRFVRTLGIDSYSDFKDALEFHGSQARHSYIQKELIEPSMYQKLVNDEIAYVYHNFDDKQLDNIISDLHKYHKIAIFGILNSDNAAKELQYNLISKGKLCISYTNFKDQIEFIKNADNETLIIIFSISGDYVQTDGYSRFYHTYDCFKQ